MKRSLVNSWLLAVMGLLLAMFSHSAHLFAVIVFVVSAVALWELYRFISTPKIRFSRTLALSILLGYGLGTAIYLVAHGTMDATEYQYWASRSLLFTQHGLSMALSACLLASAALYVRAAFEPAYVPSPMKGPIPERIVWLGTGIAALALFNGDIGYMGALVEDSRVSPLGALATLVVPALVPYTVLLLTQDRPRIKRFALLASLLFLFGVLFVIGRRFLLYSVVLSFLALGLNQHKLLTARGMLACGVALAIVYWGFTFFMAMRLSAWALGEDASLFALIDATMAQLATSEGMVKQALADNLGTRTFILGYLAGLMEVSTKYAPTLGAVLLYSLQTSIPSALLADKVHLPEEAITHPLYSLPVWDGPTSVITAGFNDFGFIGAIAYPLVLAFMFYGAFRLLRRVSGRELQVFLLFTLLFQLLYIEQSVTGVFAFLRNLLIVVAIVWAVSRLPVVRLRKLRRRSVSTPVPPQHQDQG